MADVKGDKVKEKKLVKSQNLLKFDQAPSHGGDKPANTPWSTSGYEHRH